MRPWLPRASARLPARPARGAARPGPFGAQRALIFNLRSAPLPPRPWAHPASGALGSASAWASERLRVWASARLRIWASVRLGVRASARLPICASGRLGVCVSARLRVWACGCLGVWASGRLSARRGAGPWPERSAARAWAARVSTPRGAAPETARAPGAPAGAFRPRPRARYLCPGTWCVGDASRNRHFSRLYLTV